MTLQQIQNKMEGTKGFVGVQAHNELELFPVRKRSFSCGIMNLDILAPGHGGTHWVSWANNPKIPKVYYFDSFGVEPDDRTTTFLNKFAKPIAWNKQQVQEDHSEECGHYAMLFCTEAAKGKTMQQIMSEFTKKPSLFNEQLVM
jgi:hypothetical protein